MGNISSRQIVGTFIDREKLPSRYEKSEEGNIFARMKPFGKQSMILGTKLSLFVALFLVPSSCPISLFLFPDCFLARLVNTPLTLFPERHE